MEHLKSHISTKNCVDLQAPAFKIDKVGVGVTVKFLIFWTSENFAVIYLKFEQRGQSKGFFFCQNGANGKANSEDPDQTAPLGVV